MLDLRPYRMPAVGSQPDYLSPAYGSTVKRSPSHALILLPQSLSELTGPVFGHDRVTPNDADLTRQHAGEPARYQVWAVGRGSLYIEVPPVRHACEKEWTSSFTISFWR